MLSHFRVTVLSLVITEILTEYSCITVHFLMECLANSSRDKYWNCSPNPLPGGRSTPLPSHTHSSHWLCPRTARVSARLCLLTRPLLTLGLGYVFAVPTEGLAHVLGSGVASSGHGASWEGIPRECSSCYGALSEQLANSQPVPPRPQHLCRQVRPPSVVMSLSLEPLPPTSDFQTLDG